MRICSRASAARSLASRRARRRSPCGRAKFGEIAGQRIGLGAHFRHHRAERDRGAHRLQRILRPHHQRRRRLPADALQRGENFDDHAAALVERFANTIARCRRAARAAPASASILASTSRTRAAVSISCWLNLRRSALISRSRACSLAWFSTDLRCRARAASSSWSRCLSASAPFAAGAAGAGRTAGAACVTGDCGRRRTGRRTSGRWQLSEPWREVRAKRQQTPTPSRAQGADRFGSTVGESSAFKASAQPCGMTRAEEQPGGTRNKTHSRQPRHNSVSRLRGVPDLRNRRPSAR